MSRLAWPALALSLAAVAVAGSVSTTAAAVGTWRGPAARTPDVPEAVAQVIRRTNEFRHANGLPPVVENPVLAGAAEGFAAYLSRTDRFSHEADGREPRDRATAQGYASCMVAENLALVGSTAGFTTPEIAGDFVNGWIESPGHRHNLLAPDATETGVAIAYSERSNRWYAVQMFGRPESMRITFHVGNRSREAVSYRVGDERFGLPPLVRRTHELCGDRELQFEVPGQREPVRRHPVDGASYRYESVGGHVRFDEG